MSNIVFAGINSDRVTALTTRTGKVAGSKETFGGRLSAAQVKDSLKRANPALKGGALTKKVNEVLTGREEMAWAEHDVLTSALRSTGYIPNTSEVRSKSGVVRYVKPTEPAKAKLEAANEEIEALKKELEALRLAISGKQS